MEQHANTQVRPTHPKTLGIYVPEPNKHSALPPEVSKAQAIGVICAALLVMGLQRSAILAWRFIADQTEAKAWVSTHETPMNFRKAKDLAREHGISDRHWRRIEAQLEDAGVIARATSDNGFRGKICKGEIVFGLSLEPALANFSILLDLAAQPVREELLRKKCLGQIRSLRQRLKKYHAFAPLNRELQTLWDEIEDLHRPTRPGYASLSNLEIYLHALLELETTIRLRFHKTENNPSSGDDIALPCVEIQKVHKSTNSTKMSAPADSHVLHQCNLEYNNKPLNACAMHKEEVDDQPALKQYEEDKAKKNNSICNEYLKNNHLLNLGAIGHISQFIALKDDINRVKSGTKCEKLDPQHIWERFKKYNLRRDKQILPLAALRAFIKGWIADEQVSYVKKPKREEAPTHLDPERFKLLLINHAEREARDAETKRKEQLAIEEKALKSRKEQSIGLNWFQEQSPLVQRDFLINLEEASPILSVAAVRKRWKEINYDVQCLYTESKTDQLILGEIGRKAYGDLKPALRLKKNTKGKKH